MRGSWVAVSVFIYLFISSPGCVLREGAGNRGNLFRGAAPWAATGFVRDRGLGPRAPLPARSPRTAAAFLSVRPRRGSVPAALSQSRDKDGSGAGLLAALFCRALPASPHGAGGPARRFSPGGECGQAGWYRPEPGRDETRRGDPVGGEQRGGAQPLSFCTSRPRPSGPSAPLFPPAPGELGETAEKRKFF